MKKRVKEILIGVVIGLVANIAGIYLYTFFFSEYPFMESLQFAKEQGVLGNLIALGAILNLLAFFVFMKKHQYFRARGVVFATLIAAIVILFIKFF